jgi:putative ABC transport system substrate-binding protein
LPALVQELVRKEASVIVGNSQAVEAAKAATSSIPIVFVTSDDPVARGLVASMNRPGGNVTGITFYGAQLSAKRLEVLSEIVPRAKTVGVLVDPGWPGAQSELHDIENAARRLGLRLVVARAATAGELGDAFTIFTANKVDALMVAGSPFFTSNARDVVMLAARHRIAAAYDQREFVAAGGLMSYAGSFAGAYREAGVYAARIVRGAKPSELPVLQPTTFAFTINLPAAKALRLEIPASVRLRADEVID